MIIYPFSESLYYIADLFGNYGLAVITITLIMGITLVPLFIKQSKQHKIMRESLQAIKPDLVNLQEKYKNSKEPEEFKKKQEEMVHLYKEHGINPFFYRLSTNAGSAANRNVYVLGSDGDIRTS